MSSIDYRKQISADEFISQVIGIFRLTDFEIHIVGDLDGGERVQTKIKGELDGKRFAYTNSGRSFGQALYRARQQIREEFGQ